MRKSKELCYCDRCKKDITNEHINSVIDSCYFYDLCDSCKTKFDEYESDIKVLEKAADIISKSYGLGKYAFPSRNNVSIDSKAESLG